MRHRVSYPLHTACIGLKDVVTEWVLGTGKYNRTNIFARRMFFFFFLHIGFFRDCCECRLHWSLPDSVTVFWFAQTVFVDSCNELVHCDKRKTITSCILEALSALHAEVRQHVCNISDPLLPLNIWVTTGNKCCNWEKKCLHTYHKMTVRYTKPLPISPHWHSIMEQGRSLLEKFLRSATHTPPLDLSSSGSSLICLCSLESIKHFK